MEKREKVPICEALSVQEAIDIKPILSTILHTLQQQYEEIVDFFYNKIWQMEEKLSEKDETVMNLQQQVVNLQKKYAQANQQLKRKQKTISRLQGTIQTMEKKFKESVENYLQQIQLNTQELYDRGIENYPQNKNSKRINISEYFMKASQRSKQVPKKQKDLLSDNSTFSTLCPISNNRILFQKNHSPMLERMKSVNDDNFSPRLKNEAKTYSPNSFQAGNKKIKSYLENVSKTSQWKYRHGDKGKSYQVNFIHEG